MTSRTALLLILLTAAGVAALTLAAGPAWAQQSAAAVPEGAYTWGLMAAALATGISSLAAGYAVAVVGSAAIGTIAEKPELFGRVLVFVGLAEGIAIYGLIISILILNRLGA